MLLNTNFVAEANYIKNVSYVVVWVMNERVIPNMMKTG